MKRGGLAGKEEVEEGGETLYGRDGVGEDEGASGVTEEEVVEVEILVFLLV